MSATLWKALSSALESHKYSGEKEYLEIEWKIEIERKQRFLSYIYILNTYLKFFKGELLETHCLLTLFCGEIITGLLKEKRKSALSTPGHMTTSGTYCYPFWWFHTFGCSGGLRGLLVLHSPASLPKGYVAPASFLPWDLGHLILGGWILSSSPLPNTHTHTTQTNTHTQCIIL